jgi:hypothetical protein
VLYQLSYSRKNTSLHHDLRPRYRAGERPCNRGDGDERDRTADLLNAIQALSQLSYAPGRDTPAAAVETATARARVSGTAQSSRVYLSRQA